jgi:hypothetical protein
LLALGATACGSSPSKPSAAAVPGTVTTVDSNANPTTTTAGGGATTGHVGDTLTHPDENLASDVATVTLVKVIDPAGPNSASNVADTGHRWVGLEMTFADNGDNASNASVEALATGSDGKEYAINADIEGSFAGCTATLSDLEPNQKATFCPGFMLPTGVTITKVGYSLRGSAVGTPSELTWTVP